MGVFSPVRLLLFLGFPQPGFPQCECFRVLVCRFGIHGGVMRRFLFSLRALAWRHLTAVLVVLTGLVVFSLLVTVVLADVRVRLVTVNRDVAAGSVLRAEDLVVVSRCADQAGDALVLVEDAVGRRTAVALVAGSVVRDAYLGVVPPSSSEPRVTLLLPVTVAMAQMVGVGDRVDIYRPCEGFSAVPGGAGTSIEDGAMPCRAQRLSRDAMVVEVKFDADQWGGAQSAAVVVAIDPQDTNLIAGVRDPSALVLVLVAPATPTLSVEE